MKNKKLRLIFAAVFLLATTVSLSLAFATYTDSGEDIQRVYAGYDDESIFLVGLNNVPDPPCEYSWIQFHPNWTDVDKVYKLIMTALTSGKELECNVTGCTSEGYQKGVQCRIRHKGY